MKNKANVISIFLLISIIVCIVIYLYRMMELSNSHKNAKLDEINKMSKINNVEIWKKAINEHYYCEVTLFETFDTKYTQCINLNFRKKTNEYVGRPECSIAFNISNLNQKSEDIINRVKIYNINFFYNIPYIFTFLNNSNNYVVKKCYTKSKYIEIFEYNIDGRNNKDSIFKSILKYYVKDNKIQDDGNEFRKIYLANYIRNQKTLNSEIFNGTKLDDKKIMDLIEYQEQLISSLHPRELIYILKNNDVNRENRGQNTQNDILIFKYQTILTELKTVCINQLGLFFKKNFFNSKIEFFFSKWNKYLDFKDNKIFEKKQEYKKTLTKIIEDHQKLKSALSGYLNKSIEKDIKISGEDKQNTNGEFKPENVVDEDNALKSESEGNISSEVKIRSIIRDYIQKIDKFLENCTKSTINYTIDNFRFEIQNEIKNFLESLEINYVNNINIREDMVCLSNRLSCSWDEENELRCCIDWQIKCINMLNKARKEKLKFSLPKDLKDLIENTRADTKIFDTKFCDFSNYITDLTTVFEDISFKSCIKKIKEELKKYYAYKELEPIMVTKYLTDNNDISKKQRKIGYINSFNYGKTYLLFIELVEKLINIEKTNLEYTQSKATGRKYK